MSKQIKIGFDKVPAPLTKQYPQLYDIEGAKLYDAAGNPLLTEEQGTLSSFQSAESALSSHINNAYNADDAVPVEEQFPLESEVSNTLLGVPRAEEQLSLFSDVATYGLDDDNWSYYTFDSGWNYPSGWYNRENPVFGRRGSPSFNEGSEEQALYFKTFPAQYNFPFGPAWDENSGGYYNENQYQEYLNFIAIGKILYDQFSGEYPVFAKQNFLSPSVKIVGANGDELDVDENSFFIAGRETAITGNAEFYDIDYGDDTQDSFDQIERWTAFYQKLESNTAQFPLLSGDAVPYHEAQDYQAVREFAIRNSRPGAGTRRERFGILESKRAFRYQPGRVSGFTYGIRMKTDLASNSNFIEWGCSNDTDEYMFQIRGTEFNIVRRSVIPLPTSLLERMDLDESYQTEKYPVGLGNSNKLFETIIPRSKFTGDRLDGTGDTGYILSFEDVTMFKIEFSWYGAIGAKFYAYIPSGNGECRWALIHTLVIENGLGQPILKNPDFKFKYLLYTADTRLMREPVYVYKYGSSYYIDGGDEGTVRLTSKTSDTKGFTSRTPVIGMMPKNNILNQDGIEVDNGRKSYPTTISVNSSAPARIDIEEVQGSPDGAHYIFAPSLINGISAKSKEVDIYFTETGQNVLLANTEATWAPEDEGAKIIADGIFGTYLRYDEFDTGSARVLRRNSEYNLSLSQIARLTAKSNGTELSPREGTIIPARITNYNSIAASNTPINANEFKIHFLNPSLNDTSGKLADFFIGVTYKEPFYDPANDNELRFDPQASDEFSLDDVILVEYTNNSTRLDLKNREVSEMDTPYGIRLETDPRLPNPEGVNSGTISAVRGEVSTVNYAVSSIEAVSGGEFDGQFKITFASTSAPPISESDVGVAEIGVNREGTGIVFLSEIIIDGQSNQYFAYINGDPTSGGSVVVDHIQSKVVTLKNDWQLESFSEDGTPRFTSHNWSYSRVLRFNVQPLYLVVGMKDNARVNNITIEEITPQTVSASTPNFLLSEDSITVEQPEGSSSILTPSAFSSDDRLSSVRFDTQTLQPLRNGKVIYSFFVEGGKPERIDLDNIFAQDRKGITRGLLNNKAIFFTATGLEGGGDIEMTLTVKEQ